ncbi:hypothetical protein EST38_g9620 [Candolleomyces aberdarensis]|uniref:Uncharacterized protein n=1 Tax=Candolleomyces aberdarensis TaxID=2316362 RepID=A0A4Q2DCD5_9AGAR|nr:hypothetical protein EST38_g9620 [Candolleomyces aberdarensis]
MYDTFSRNHAANPDSDDRKPGHAARRMIVRIVNSLSAKMEIGAPMAALYLLKNPDHYASHDFRVFYWKNYVNHVELEWRRLIDNGDPDLVGYQPTAGDREDVGVTRLDNLNPDILNLPEEDGDENVQMSKAGDRERQLQIMENFNIRYECYDARDDFGAVFKAATTGAADGDADQSGDEGEPANYFEDALDDDLEFLPGPQAASLEMSNVQSRKALQMAGMRLPESSTHSVNDFALPRIAIHGNVTAFAWKQLIKAEQNRLWNQRFAALPAPDGFASRNLAVKNDAYIMPASYLTKQFVPSIPEWRSVIDRIAKDFTLNDEQNKAFKIVANHATCIVPDQLLMYLGGMGEVNLTDLFCSDPPEQLLLSLGVPRITRSLG